MPTNATDILENAESTHERVSGNRRDGADWFHDHEGELFEREEVIAELTDALDVEAGVASDILAELTGDTVDPVVQVQSEGVKYYGVIDYVTFEGAYGYVDYHDYLGARRRVVCAQCVQEATVDSAVTHATAGDPSGSFSDQPDASYEELLEAIKQHYTSAHEGTPETVETGASLASPTTIGGNTAWHAGNDGSSSTLDADSVDGLDKSDLVEVAGDTMSGDLTMGANDIDFKAAGVIRRSAGIEFDNQDNNRYRPQISSGGTESENVFFGWRDTNDDTRTEFLTVDKNNDYLDLSGRSQDLRLATGQAIEDGSGTERVEIDTDRTRLKDTDGVFISGSPGSYVWTIARSGKPLRVDDAESGGVGVRDDTGASAGVLRTPNAQLSVESSGAIPSGDSLLLRQSDVESFISHVQAGSELSRIQLEDGLINFASVSADLRLATGQAIEDGSGTERITLNSSYTEIKGDAGTVLISAGTGTSGDGIFLRPTQSRPLKVFDQQGDFDAVQYTTSATDPGTLQLPKADLDVQNNSITTDNFEVTENGTTNSLDFNYTG
jgi:hypothetical protein